MPIFANSRAVRVSPFLLSAFWMIMTLLAAPSMKKFPAIVLPAASATSCCVLAPALINKGRYKVTYTDFKCTYPEFNSSLCMGTQKERKSRRNVRNSAPKTHKILNTHRHQQPRQSKRDNRKPPIESQHQTTPRYNLHRLLEVYREIMATTKIHQRKHAPLHPNRTRNGQPNRIRKTQNRNTPTTLKRNRMSYRRGTTTTMDTHRRTAQNRLYHSRERQ